MRTTTNMLQSNIIFFNYSVEKLLCDWNWPWAPNIALSVPWSWNWFVNWFVISSNVIPFESGKLVAKLLLWLCWLLKVLLFCWLVFCRNWLRIFCWLFEFVQSFWWLVGWDCCDVWAWLLLEFELEDPNWPWSAASWLARMLAIALEFAAFGWFASYGKKVMSWINNMIFKFANTYQKINPDQKID